MEFKYGSAPLPYGQRLALERMCDDLQGKKETILIIASHDAAIGQDINAAEAMAVEYRYRGEWTTTHETTKNLVADFLRHLDGMVR